MKTLRIYNYEILNFDSSPHVFSTSGFTKINNSKIINTLHTIDSIKPRHLSQKELEQIIQKENLPTESTINFLKSIRIIGEESEAPYFDNTIIYTDFEFPEALTKSAEIKSGNKLSFLKFDNLEVTKSATPKLFIFAFQKLSPALLRKTYRNLMQNNPECGISVGFVSGSFFHLTEVHIPAIGNPCAFCFFDRISHYEKQRPSKHQWCRIWNFCNSNELDLPSTPIEELSAALILATIISFSSKFTTPSKHKITQDQVLASRTLDMNSGHYSEDNSVHWAFCGCLGGKHED